MSGFITCHEKASVVRGKLISGEQIMIPKDLVLKMVGLMPEWTIYEQEQLLLTGKISPRAFYYLLDVETSLIAPHEFEIIRQNVQRVYTRGPSRQPISIDPEIMANLLKRLYEGLS